jgi:hypothetical protein
LEVLAVNFMRVGGTVESSLANAAMMGQAVVDKVCWYASLYVIGLTNVILGSRKVGCRLRNGVWNLAVPLEFHSYHFRIHTIDNS